MHVTYEKDDRVLILAFKVLTHAVQERLQSHPDAQSRTSPALPACMLSPSAQGSVNPFDINLAQPVRLPESWTYHLT